MNKKNLKQMIDIEDLKAELLKHLNSGENNTFKYEFSPQLYVGSSDENVISMRLEHSTDSTFTRENFELFIFKNTKTKQNNLSSNVFCDRIKTFHYSSYYTKNVVVVDKNKYEDEGRAYLAATYLFSIKFTLKLALN